VKLEDNHDVGCLSAAEPKCDHKVGSSDEASNALQGDDEKQKDHDVESSSNDEMPTSPSMDPRQTGTKLSSVPVTTLPSYPMGIPQTRVETQTIDSQQKRTPPVSISAPQSYEDCQLSSQAEENKRDDYDVGFPTAMNVVACLNAVEPENDYQIRSSREDNHESQGEVENQEGNGVGSISESKGEYNHEEELMSDSKLENKETSLEAEERLPVHVILSLTDDHYKEIMWRHYTILGKERDSDKEAVIGTEVFSLLKQKLGETGKFFKRFHKQDIEVDDEQALAKIIADIGRRMNSYMKWAPPPVEKAAKPKTTSRPLEYAPKTKPPSPPMSLPRKDHRSEISSTNDNMSTRRSTRKHAASEANMKKYESGDEDVILSLSDDRYKEIMWRQYNILGKKEPWDMRREEDVGHQVFLSLKSRLGSGNFLKKNFRGDKLFVVDDQEALQKITQDLKRRNESIHKWRRINNNNKWGNAPLPAYQGIAGPLSIEQDHEWRDQLAPSSIEAVANYHPPSSQVYAPPNITHVVDTRNVDTHPVSTRPVDTHATDEKPPSLLNHAHTSSTKPNHVQKSKPKSSIELLTSSHLGQRLTPLKHIPAVKSIQTPNQLIHMLQHATHKLNEMYGTQSKHCKVLRLYHLPELNDSSKSVTTKAPTLSQLAEFMETTAKRLHKWYTMYQNAVTKGFDFEKFGEEKIKDHYGIFFATEKRYFLSKCGERAMEEHFLEVGKRVVEGNRTDPKCNVVDVMPRINVDANNDGSFSGSKNPFLHHFERNQARLLNLKNKPGEDVNPLVLAIQLSSIAKRIKRGEKDRMVCMVVDCGKHAQTRCDGCCTAHFRLLSFTGKYKKAGKNRKAGKEKKKPTQTPTKTSMQPPVEDNFDRRKSESFSTLGKRKASKIDVQTSPLKSNSILGKLEPGSRIFVQWNGDLFKATVKKLFFDREVPMVKIHYDGKKRHILDTVPLEMVNSFIDGEPGIKRKLADHATQSLNKSQKTDVNDDSPTNSNFPPLQRLYPGVVPPGEDEITEPCPELGSGWNVYIVSRKGHIDGPRTDRYFISPTGKKFRSVPEVERYYWQNPVEFGGLFNDMRKSDDTVVPKIEDGRLDKECQEISAINRRHLPTHTDEICFLTENRHKVSMAKSPASESPNSPQRDPKNGGTRSIISVSPITTLQSCENQQSSKKNNPEVSLNGERAQVASLEVVPKQKTKKLSSMSPNQVSNPASNTSAKKGSVGTPLHRQLYQTSSMTTNMSNLQTKSTSAAQTNHGKYSLTTLRRDNATHETSERRRPKRMPKPVTRFDEEDIPSSRSFSRSLALNVRQSKSALCHCFVCDKRNLSVQGIYAHYGRAHSGKLPWQNVTFSCPFCPSSGPAASQIFNSFAEIEAHVRAFHSGCDVVGPHPSKLSGHAVSAKSVGVQNKSPKLRHDVVSKSDRVLRERKTIAQQSDDVSTKHLHVETPQAVPQKQGLPSWTKIEYVQLLPDGKKEYPRDLCRVIDKIDEQCQAQEEIVGVAHVQRMKLCRSEAESETRAMDEERLLYARGVRDRMRMADGERIEKQKFTEKAEHMMIRYQYENRNRRRNQEDIEVDKLCSRPIRFSKETQRHNTRQGKACADDDCQFCKKDKGYLHHLLLDDEMSAFKMSAPPTQSPVFQQCTKVLNPAFRIIHEDFLQAEESENDNDDGKEGSGGKRAIQSRRDASTAKRLKMEEDKLLMLKNTKHSLEFIKKYNSGMITNAWGEMKKDNRGRKSY